SARPASRWHGHAAVDRRAVAADGAGTKAHRGDHRLDDLGGAQRSSHPQRQPQAPDRSWLRNDGRERQSAHQAVCGDAADDATALRFRPFRRQRPERQDDAEDHGDAGYGWFWRRRWRHAGFAVSAGWSIKKETEEETKEA